MRLQRFRGNVFVANLPRDLQDEQLAEAFDRFGLVLGALVARDPATGVAKGYGLVNLAPDRAAAEAVKVMNGAEIGGRKANVRLADQSKSLRIPRSSRSALRPSQLSPAWGRPSSEPSSPRRTVVVEYRSLSRRF